MSKTRIKLTSDWHRDCSVDSIQHWGDVIFGSPIFCHGNFSKPFFDRTKLWTKRLEFGDTNALEGKQLNIDKNYIIIINVVVVVVVVRTRHSI